MVERVQGGGEEMTDVTVGQLIDAVYDRYDGKAPMIDGGVDLGSIVVTVIEVLGELSGAVGIGELE